MTLKSGSKIHRKAIVLRTVGTIHGSSTAARMRRWNLTMRFRRIASQMPSAHLTTVATPVYAKLFQNVVQKTPSRATRAREFASPVNCTCDQGMPMRLLVRLIHTPQLNG